MKCFFGTIVLLLICNYVQAEATWFTSEIKTVYPLSNGDVVVTFVSDSPNCTSGSNPKYHYLRVGENNITSDGAEKIYSLFLTAATTGRKVTINFDDSTNYCYINRASIKFQ